MAHFTVGVAPDAFPLQPAHGFVIAMTFGLAAAPF
jgi:hypothetical protein